MGDWTLFDATGQVRAGLSEEDAKALVDWNHEHGNDGVYAMGPNGERYPEDGQPQ